MRARPRLLVVPMGPQHLDTILEIEGASFGQPWNRELFAAELRHPQALPLCALTLPSLQVAGYLCLWLVAGEAQVQNLATHPVWRHLGVARFLLKTGLKEAQRRGCRLATLEVRPSNWAARDLYDSLGFAQVGRRPNYYRAEGEDALLLDCDLTRADWV